MYTVRLQLRGKACLVVGGGAVALRKIQGLLQDGARVTVVAPEPIAEVEQLARGGDIDLARRAYRSGDAASFALVFAATDDRQTNRRVFEEADAAGIWANVADDPELCSFHLPARVRRGPLELSIGSAGEAPFAVRRLRQLLGKRFGPEWGEWMEAAARFRGSIRALGLSRIAEEERYDSFFGTTVDAQSLKARVPTAAEEKSWLGDAASGDEHEDTLPAHVAPGDATEPGFVSLVGAGPGDAGLLTVRGRQRLLEADVVLYDKLATNAIPCDLDPRVELRSVGKQAGHHSVPQEETNSLVVRLALAGKRVVRLKGGDPLVFGRGGEEAAALEEAGVPYEIVPGVTSGLAAPAYAGIPITRRGDASQVTLVTAHESIKRSGPQVRWDLLAADPHATLVGYMGVTALPNVVRELLASGMDPKTPAAMIERGTTAGQRVARAPLEDLQDAIVREGIAPPALFIIGTTVRHADELNWHMRRPLFGQRIGLRPGARDLVAALEQHGAEVVAMPLPLRPAARVVLAEQPLTGWVLRHAEEVGALEDERDAAGWSEDTVIYSVCEEATESARGAGWRHVKEIGGPDVATNLVAAIREHAQAARQREDAKA